MHTDLTPNGGRHASKYIHEREVDNNRATCEVWIPCSGQWPAKPRIASPVAQWSAKMLVMCATFLYERKNVAELLWGLRMLDGPELGGPFRLSGAPLRLLKKHALVCTCSVGFSSLNPLSCLEPHRLPSEDLENENCILSRRRVCALDVLTRLRQGFYGRTLSSGSRLDHRSRSGADETCSSPSIRLLGSTSSSPCRVGWWSKFQPFGFTLWWRTACLTQEL